MLVSEVTVAERLFVALDVPDRASALSLAEQLAPTGVSFKVGMQLFYAEGLQLVRELISSNRQTVFVDLKLHDIPNTVAGAVDSLVSQGVQFLNVHVQGGPEMMRAAVEAAQNTARQNGFPKPKLIGVTVLTSLSEQHLNEFLKVSGYSVKTYVQYMAQQAQRCGLDGVVCSAQEVTAIREVCGSGFLTVTPGIRPLDASVSDQSRVITPKQALQNGADYLVVGRPIVQAANPVDATRRILDEMVEALNA